MKIIVMSDLHGYLPEYLPACDIICICGDISPLQIQRYTKPMKIWFEEYFMPWVNKQECNKVVMIAGNHDFLLFNHPEYIETTVKSQNKLIVLEDSEAVIGGISFYGSPWCPELSRWPYFATPKELSEKFSKIPDNLDILLTHCPPRIENLGVVLQENTFNNGNNYGCIELANTIEQKRPNWVFSGHVHSGDHNPVTFGKSILYNVSLLDENYSVAYDPLILNI